MLIQNLRRERMLHSLRALKDMLWDQESLRMYLYDIPDEFMTEFPSAVRQTSDKPRRGRVLRRRDSRGASRGSGSGSGSGSVAHKKRQ